MTQHRRKDEQFVMLSMTRGKSMGRKATNSWGSNRNGGEKVRCMGHVIEKKQEKRHKAK